MLSQDEPQKDEAPTRDRANAKPVLQTAINKVMNRPYLKEQEEVSRLDYDTPEKNRPIEIEGLPSADFS